MKKKMKNQINAILFDLDGTLLHLDINPFIRDYLRGLSACVAHILPPKKFIPYLMKMSKIMEENDGTDTNENVFKKAFFPFEGRSQEEMEPIFMRYYEQEFPKLRNLGTKKPEAPKLMQLAFDKGYDVVIATTPLLPEIAIIERLKWADIADFPYKMITSYENMKATKPNLLYFEQILDTIEQQANSCLMVGDEHKDLVAANLGIQTFLVPSPETNINPSTPKPNFEGTLSDLMDLI